MSRGFLLSLLVSLIVAVGCSSNNSSSPTAATASVAVPRPQLPANQSQIANIAQPVTLVVQNAIVTQSGGTTYAFEVATDPAFSTKVQVKTGVAEGSSGQTSLSLGLLPAATTYYWHAQATAGGTVGIFSAPFQFSIGASITIFAPTLVAPANGASTTTMPTLTIVDAARSGPVGVIAYRFDIATTPTFSNVTVTATVPEGPGQTAFTPTTPLTINATYYWRATAIDQSNVVAGPSSPVGSFTASTTQVTAAAVLAAQEGAVLWPGVQPPGIPGHAQMGSDWTVEVLIDYTGARFLNPVFDALRVFDLLDRGMDPQSAIDWMNANGYPTIAAYYPSVQVVGFPQEYMAFVNGVWSMVRRVGA